MNENRLPEANLPGLEEILSTAVPPPSAPPAVAAAPRVKPVDRSQLVWHWMDVDRLIEADHPARAIWELTGRLELQGFYAPIAAVQGGAGRAPWDPRLLVSLWVYAYSRGISSARELERRSGFDPGFQWLCGLEIINHHTLSDFRVAHGAALQELFVQVLGVLSTQGLVSLERIMHDGTKIKACASSDSFGQEDKLRAHLEAARQQVERLGQETSEEGTRAQAAQERAVRERQQRVEKALEQLEAIRQSKESAQEKAQARASLSDPQARVMKQADGGYAPSYNVQLSTEASHKIIVGVGVSQQGNDGGSLLMEGVARVEANLQGQPKQVVTDGGFTTRHNILQAAEQGIDLIGSFGEQSAKGAGNWKLRGVDQEFAGPAFGYDADQDSYSCPGGQRLSPVAQDGRSPGVVKYFYRAPKGVCQNCPFQARCCPQAGPQGRTVSRLVESAPVREFREKMQSAAAQQIYRQRAPVAEFPNAWIKDKLGLRQFRLRGLVKVSLETLWACLTYNIQQWIRLSWRPSLAEAKN